LRRKHLDWVRVANVFGFKALTLEQRQAEDHSTDFAPKREQPQQAVCG
jgi:hypothetical protein